MKRAPATPIAVLVDREGLGDVMLKRPFLRALRTTFPDNEVWWIATHQTSMADELRALVGADVARVIPQSGLDGPIRPLVRRLRDLPPFEKVFDSRTKISTVALTRLNLRARGFYSCLPGYFCCDGQPPAGRRRPRHIAWRMLSLVECATGAPPPDPDRLAAGQAAVAAAAVELPEGPIYVGVAPGSRQRDKNWPVEQFIETARALIAQGMTPVFFLGPMEEIDDASLAAATVGARVIRAPPDLAPAASVERLVAQAGRLAALIANDNGVGHLMGAAGTPVLSLFGPTSPERWAPVAPENVILWSKDFGGAGDIRAIPTASVASAAAAMLGRAAPPPQARRGRLGLVKRPAHG